MGVSMNSMKWLYVIGVYKSNFVGVKMFGIFPLRGMNVLEAL